jgi:hypothetical protein
MPTIRTAADKITATVTAFGKVKESQFNEGSYQSVLFESPALPDGKVWRSMDPDQAQGFTRGQQVYLVPTTNKQGKPSYDIELIAPTAPAATPQAPTQGKPASQGTSLDAMAPEEKAQIASYITSISALYAYCYQQAAHHLSPHGAPEPAIQAAASTTFIQASRKFSL